MSNNPMENTISARLKRVAGQVCDCFREAALAENCDDLVAILAYVTSYPSYKIEKLVFDHRLPSPRQLTWMAGCLDRELVMKAVPHGRSRVSRKTGADGAKPKRFVARPGENAAARALAALLRQSLREYSLESVAMLAGLSLREVQALTRKCKSFQLAELLLSTVGLTLSITCRDPYADLVPAAGQSSRNETCRGACGISDDWRLFIAQSHALARKMALGKRLASGGVKRLGIRHCNG